MRRLELLRAAEKQPHRASECWRDILAHQTPELLGDDKVDIDAKQGDVMLPGLEKRRRDSIGRRLDRWWLVVLVRSSTVREYVSETESHTRTAPIRGNECT